MIVDKSCERRCGRSIARNVLQLVTLIFDEFFFRKLIILSINSPNPIFSSCIEVSFLCMSTYLVFTVVPHRTK